MKTTILICIALLFGFTVSAQDTGTQSELPYASFEYEEMNFDCNDPYPWSVVSTKNVADCNDPVPYIISVTKNVPLDANLTIGGPAKRTYTYPSSNSDLPNTKNRYNISVKKPVCCNY